MLAALGVGLAAYATFAIGQGEVYTRSGWWGSLVRRDRRPRAFWVAVGAYFSVSLLLLFVV